jgi:hypothetical protein
VVYCVIDSTFSFHLKKVYISAVAESLEVEILYRRGELSPQLYHLHHKLKRETSNVLTSAKGNTLQDFVYNERTHQYQMNNQQNTLNPINEKNEIEIEWEKLKKTTSSQQQSSTSHSLEHLKEMYHFNQVILTKVIDFLVNYLEKQPQMKSMILKMTDSALKSSSSSVALNGEEQEEKDNQQDNKLPSQQQSKKMEKSKSKVGILLYLFFLESIHHILYHLPSLPGPFDHPGHRRQPPTKLPDNHKIQEIYYYCLSSYNRNNGFGKLIRFLFQQILFYLFSNNAYYQGSHTISHEPLCSLSLNNDSTDRRGIERSDSQKSYSDLVERICHMDIISNVLPYLTFEDVYECLFLFFPQSTLIFLHNHPSNYHPTEGFSSSSLSTPIPLSRVPSSSSQSSGKPRKIPQSPSSSVNTSSSASSPHPLTKGSLFGNIDNLKHIIQYFFHEINQNTYYILIANDIYDILSFHINWEQFMKQLK